MTVEKQLERHENAISRIGNESRATTQTLESHMKIEEVLLKTLNKTVDGISESNKQILVEFKTLNNRVETLHNNQRDNTDILIRQCYQDMEKGLSDRLTEAQVQVKCDDVVMLMRKENIKCAENIEKDFLKKLKIVGWSFGLIALVLSNANSVIKYIIEHLK